MVSPQGKKNNSHVDHVIVNVPTSVSFASSAGTTPTTITCATSTTITQQQQQQLEDDKDGHAILHRAVQDAGRWAYGTVFVEVWVLNETKTKLFRPSGGLWVDSAFSSAVLASNSVNVATAGLGLLDPTSPNYVQPLPVSQGVGLPGALWSEVKPSSNTAATTTTTHREAAADNDDATAQQQQHHHHHHQVIWRDLQAISRDPDQPYDKRVKLMVRCGLGWAAAVPFENQHHHGIVIYVARQTTNRKKIQSPSNEAYLQSASELIGSALALAGPRREAVSSRKSELRGALQRAKSKLVSMKRMGMDLSPLIEKPPKTPTVEEVVMEEPITKSVMASYYLAVYSSKKATSLWNKCKGGNVPPPPAFNWEQTIWTFCAVFFTMLMIMRTNVYLKEEYGNGYSISLGPIGAVMTLLYGLTAAPASQPRNIIVGQTISITIGMCFSYWTDLDMYLRQGLATAIAVGVMVRLGITHPPAGASAFAFSSGESTWGNMLFLLVANVIAIVAATLMNNFSDKRQYPTAWDFSPLSQLCATKKGDDADEDDDGAGPKK